MQRNINDWERAASVIAGAALVAYAARRAERRGMATAAGTGLILRGLSGYCPISAAIGRDTRREDTRVALAGTRGIHVRESVTIARPIHEVYAFWRELTNLPRFMTHLERVEVLGPTRSRWTAHAPGGLTVSWDAEIINEVPNEVIGWRSLPGADVTSAGAVQFKSAHRATQIVVHLQYEPPGGRLGAVFAKVFGEEPSRQIREDLRRLKAYLETGEAPTVEGQPSGRDRFPAHQTTDGRVRPFTPGGREREGREGMVAAGLHGYEESV